MKTLLMTGTLALAALSMTACATPLDYKTGTEVTAAQMSQFVPGQTTQSQVVAAVGQPNRKENVSGKELWYYDFNRVGMMFKNDSEATVMEWTGSVLSNVYKTGKSGKTGNALLDRANGN